MKNAITILSLMLCVSSCNIQKDEPQNSKALKIIKADSIEANPKIDFVRHFLIWFKRNHNSSLSVQLINTKNTTYQLDSVGVRSFIKTLKKSGYFSDNINDLYGYILSCGEYIRKEKQDDGPAYGFEGDLILKSNEVEGILELVNDSIPLFFKKIDSYTFNVYSEEILELDFTVVEKNGDYKLKKLEIGLENTLLQSVCAN